MNYKLSSIAKVTNGELIGEDTLFSGLKINSNLIKQGDLFIPTIGSRDGHDFIEDAISKGAVCAIVSKKVDINIPYVLVDDTLEALKLIAKAHIDKLEKKPKVFAITGSVGKTTTKDLLVEILQKKHEVVYTEKNYNTPYSVPFTLLKVKESTDALVLELSATSKEDMEFFTSMIKFDYALITKIGEAHMESFGTLENVIEAKSLIFNGLNDGGIAFRNFNDKNSQEIKTPKNAKPYIIYPDEVSNIAQDKYGYYSFDIDSHHVHLKIPSKPVFEDAVMALTLAKVSGVDSKSIADALNDSIRVSEHRMSRMTINDVILIDDSYNANPVSMKSSIDFAISRKRDTRKLFLVLGEMAELGENSEKYHKEIGEYLQGKNFDELILVGKYARYIAFRNEKSKFFDTNEEVLEYIKSIVQPNDIYFFKGSNSNKLFEMIDPLVKYIKENI